MNHIRILIKPSIILVATLVVLAGAFTVFGASQGTDVLAGADALSEVLIDVNPTDPQNLVIVGHDAALQTMNTFYTNDGGDTWTPVAIGDADDGITATRRFDPTVAFDENGNVYMAYGAVSGTPSQTTVVVGTSTDGGQNYTFTQITTNADIGDLRGNDKWHLATGPDPANPSQQNVYIAWTRNIDESGSTDQQIVVASSTDGGTTFSAPTIINDASVSGTSSGNLFADPAVGPNGELYVVWHRIDNNDVFFDLSLDGGVTWGTDSQATTSSTGFKVSIPAQPDRGVFVGPTLDTDRSGGTYNGRLYLAYTDTSGMPDVDIYVRTSDNDGASWSAPVLVNDDGGDKSQFLPWLDVDQVTGLVTATWYDARNDADNKQVEVYAAFSANGGANWTNLKVSDFASDMSTDNAARYMGNFLEYIGIATYDCRAVPVWADNHADGGDQDYYIDRVLILNSDTPLCNHPPTADANGPYFTDEGIEVVLDGSGSSDPDGDPLTYEWDLDNDGLFDDAVGPNPTFDMVGQDGVFPVALRVSDPSGLFDVDETTVTVENVPPTVELESDAPVDENSPVMVSGVISDPGWLDPLTATIDWGDGSPVEVITGVLENNPPFATLTFSVSHTYGDNYTFEAEVCAQDDDAETCETIDLQIDNVVPTAEIDLSGTLLINGIPTFLAHAGEELTFSGRSTDPGSDDLILRWDWDDGSPIDETTYLVNPPDPDPYPSPSIQPRDVTDEVTHTFGEACLYEISFWAEDDDGGLSEVDNAVVIITGNAKETRTAGYWTHQYRGNGHTVFDEQSLECYLEIVGYMSQVFNEERDASTIEKAVDVLRVNQNHGSMEEIFDRQLLAVWLNFANGAVDWDTMVDTDGNGSLDTPFNEAVMTAEMVRLDPNATRYELEMQKDIMEGINMHGVYPPDLMTPAVVAHVYADGRSRVITLVASDDYAGIKAIYYSLDDERYLEYTGPIEVSINTTRMIYAYAQDNTDKISDTILIPIYTQIFLPIINH